MDNQKHGETGGSNVKENADVAKPLKNKAQENEPSSNSAPAFLRAAERSPVSALSSSVKPVASSTNSRSPNAVSDSASASSGVRPSRGPNPFIFMVLSLLLAGLSVAFSKGAISPIPFDADAFTFTFIMGAFAGAFALLSAWAVGRRVRVDDEALLVHLAAGESGEPLMVTSRDGEVLYANPGFGVLLKRNSVGKVPDILRLEGEDPAAADAVTRMLGAGLNGARDHEELAINTVSAGLQAWRLSVRPAGRVGSGLVAWTARDVTALRELEKVRRSEEALLADLLDNLPVGFFSVNGMGRIVYANETLCEWLGLSLNEMSAQKLSFADFVMESGEHEQDDDGHNGQVTLRSNKGAEFRAMLVQSGRVDGDGELLYTRSVVIRDLVRKPTAPEASTITVSDKGAEAVARRLYWLFDEAPVAIALLDLQGNISDCNQSFLKMLGLHKDDVLEKPFSERLATEDLSDVTGQLSKVVMGIMRAAHIDIKLTATAGREVAASLYVSSMEDAYGDVTGLVLHLIDTTEHKHLELQFAQSQKMQSIGQLAGGIAHDFNNLLTAMIGFSDLLLERHGPGDPSFGDIDQIRQNAVRATALVRQLLAFSRKQTLAPQAVDVKEKLSDLSEVLGRLLGATIEYNIEHDRDVWTVRVDPVQFDQIIINLAVNARDAMPGGGTLTIRTGNLTLDEPSQRGMELVPAGDYVTIDVIDTGEGIRKEDIGQIFDPFFTTKDVGEGTGLGLSTVYGIVHQTGGHIQVDSAPGEGAAFTVCLPRHMNPPEVLTKKVQPTLEAEDLKRVDTKGSKAAPEADLTGAGTILLVEDEEAVRMFGARALRNKGYTVLEAANGEEALEVINSTEAKINLIVTDVMMPGMDGHTLVQFVVQEIKDIKVIFISGYAENVIPGGITPESGFEFLPKPFSLKDLAAKVKEVLAK